MCLHLSGEAGPELSWSHCPLSGVGAVAALRPAPAETHLGGRAHPALLRRRRTPCPSPGPLLRLLPERPAPEGSPGRHSAAA